ncbi:hypothetical protein AcV7_002714 [Taiwanofungus camphoratus]|nr:hypothetical protein AcV7_002714 [Antrodia cinnamomea]
MNVISFDKAFCLYPRATLEERRALVCGREGLRQESAIAKYAARGWQMVDELPLEDRGNDNRSFRFGPRWIKDGDSWVIPLNLDDVVGPPPFTARSTPLSEDPVISTTWKLVYDLSQRAMMVYSVLSSPILRYSYLIMDEELDDVLTQVLERRRESEFDRQDRPLFNIRRYFDESLLIISQAHLQEQKLIGLRP